jgi:tetratricopeptide (TPR) repeat protein
MKHRIAKRLVAMSIALVVAAIAGCGPRAAKPDLSPPEAWSLDGRSPLYRADFPPERRAALERDLDAAVLAYDADPRDESAIIWYGRRLGYLWRFNEAVRIFEHGLAHHPDSFRIRRHLGHRLITLRRFDDAQRMLREAGELVRGMPDETEPDGAPNALNIPTSTTQSNIWYHLGLAHFLEGEYDLALAAYSECLNVSTNDDMWCATAHWTWMTLMRLGRAEEAQRLAARARSDMTIIENGAYHALLMLYRRGNRPAIEFDSRGRAFPVVDRPFGPMGASVRSSDAAYAFGVANWYLVHDEVDTALALCRGIVSAGEWPSFGHIAAEAELAWHAE